jgi:hypothetical protein
MQGFAHGVPRARARNPAGAPGEPHGAHTARGGAIAQWRLTSMRLRPRVLPALAALVTLGLGLGSRALLIGLPAKVLGVAFYATLVYALVVLVAPGVRVGRALVIAIGLCWAIELAQLTPGPAHLSAQHFLLRLVFGATFSVWDLVTYVPGALLGAAVHMAARRGR